MALSVYVDDILTTWSGIHSVQQDIKKSNVKKESDWENLQERTTNTISEEEQQDIKNQT